LFDCVVFSKIFTSIESLYGCFDNIDICCCGVCCIPCLFGNNAEKIDDSNCCLMCCIYTLLTPCYLCWVPHMSKRTALRYKYGLNEDPDCGDCGAACCCPLCALCQEARFLERQSKNQFEENTNS